MFWKNSIRKRLREIFYPFKRFYTGVKRLIEFTPIIWNSYDWDYTYATNLFQFQLLRMADYFDKHGNLETNRHSAQRIRTVCKLMDRSYNEYYIDAAYDSLMEKYGKEAFEFELSPTDYGKNSLCFKYESYRISEMSPFSTPCFTAHPGSLSCKQFENLQFNETF
jgi:hypothetical protein